MREDEVCPKCHSPNIGVCCFNSERVSYQCNNKECRHRWVVPRRFSVSIMKAHYDVTCQRCSQRIAPPLRCLIGVGKYHTDALFFACPRCGQVYYDEGDFIVKKLFNRKGAQKFEATSLKELCQKFEESKDNKMLVRPYLPKIEEKGQPDLGLIVECENAIYETGLSRNDFLGSSPLSGWRWGKPRENGFDFSSTREIIERFENFARHLSLYLTEKGYPATPLEIQHLNRKPNWIEAHEHLRLLYHRTLDKESRYMHT